MKTNFAKVHSVQAHLINTYTIDVEIDLSRGLHSFSIVGLPDKGVEEAKDRVSAAIKHSGFTSPKSKNQKITVSLAPADVRKEGPSFDLPIALSYLLASGEIFFDPKEKIFAGELSLDGKTRGIRGALPLSRHALKRGFKEVFVPEENAEEAALTEGVDVFGVKNLKELIEHLLGNKKIPKTKRILPKLKARFNDFDIKDIKGQEAAKRGLEIAAAGGHNIALYGPAGTGKTLLAKALPQILPPLSFEEALEVTSIHSIAGILEEPLLQTPPFRAPHHTSSYVSIVGGGTFPKPGEVTLAHRGVLFMDEFPEFERRVIDALRQPLEDRVVSIARSKGSETFPANVLLIAALNPCPCGNFGSTKECLCSPKDLGRYQKRLSGPIVDRIDMWIEVPLIKHHSLLKKGGGGDADLVRERIGRARKIQENRFTKNDRGVRLNSEMNGKEIENFIPLGEKERELILKSAEALNLSPRSFHKVLKLSRTIADLEESTEVEESHILEALQYRRKSAF